MISEERDQKDEDINLDIEDGVEKASSVKNEGGEADSERLSVL